MARRLFLIFVAFLNLYAIASAVGIIIAWNRYKYTDLSRIERPAYLPTLLDKLDERLVCAGPRSQKTEFNTYHYFINSLGARNSFEVAPGDRVVYLLGDSFIFGFGLDDGYTLADFLGSLDPERKYLNLGVPGFNIWDSVERYLLRKKTLPKPEMVIIGVTGNDAYDSRYVYELVDKEIKKWLVYILPPFNRILTYAMLKKQYLDQIESKVFQDKSRRRFTEYFEKPLDKLIAALPKGTRLMVVCYNSDYRGELAEYCRRSGVIFLSVMDELGESWTADCLKDGHPTGHANRLLAERIEAELKK